MQCESRHQSRRGRDAARRYTGPHMFRIVTLPLLVAWLAAATAAADEAPAAGKLLVATDEIHGEIFARTVILLLHYDENGAMGLVVNRPTDVEPGEVMEDSGTLSDYQGTLFWGGPVEMAGLRVLAHAGERPSGATTILDGIHLVPFEAMLDILPADATRLRLYIGYAGWAPGQLDGELDIGSWHVRDATREIVFAEDPRSIWRDLRPLREYRAAVPVDRVRRRAGHLF